MREDDGVRAPDDEDYRPPAVRPLGSVEELTGSLDSGFSVRP